MSLARLLSRSVLNCTRGFDCGVSSYLVTPSSRQRYSSAFLLNDCVTKGSFRSTSIPSSFAVRHKSDKPADRQPPASAASEVNRVFEEEADKLRPPPAKPFEPGVKPDPQRMARMVHPRWEEASADTGGYIKLDDIGFDERDVDAKSRELLSKDERLKKWDPKDTGRRDELPYGLLKKKQEKEKHSENESGKDEKTEAPEKEKGGKIQEREEEGKSGKKNKQEVESVSQKSGENARQQENGEDDEKNGERDEVKNQPTVKKEGKSGKKMEEDEKSSSKKSGKNMRQQENDGEDDEENQVNDKVKNQSMAKKEAEKGKKNKQDEPSTSKKSRKNERQEEDDEDNIEEKKDEADAKRSPAQSTQQTVLWESSRRSTSGAQSSSDGGGMGQLTEQLLDRDEADARTDRQLAEEQEEGREKWKEKENEQGAGRQRKE